MEKIYQTIFEHKKGNCYMAVLASLLGIELEEVPFFFETEDWYERCVDFMQNHGYEDGFYHTGKDPHFMLPDTLSEENSVNGFFDAVVFSPKYFDIWEYEQNGTTACHSVICDKYYNIIHDPNPEYAGVVYPLSSVLGKNGIIGVQYWRKIETH